MGAAGLLSLFFAASARAEFHFMPDVAAQATYDSNVFALSSEGQAIAQTGSSRRDDIVSRYLAGATSDYSWSLQKLYATIEGRRFLYDHFGELNHNEYLLNSGFDWHLGSVFDGTLSYRQERSMTLFSDLATTALTMQRERKARGTFNAMVTPEWRLESGVKNHELVLPLQGEPSFALDENSVDGAIKYLGVERLAAGLYAEYLRGYYQGEPKEDRFYQKTGELTATYTVSGLSNVGARLGYTRRQGQASSEQNLTAITGNLSYIRKISGKTTLSAELFRRIDSYITGANAVVDNGAAASMFWQPTLKISAYARYEWTESSFQGRGGAFAGTGNRRDHAQSTLLNVSYQPLYWLFVQPFFKYQDRSSNLQLASYNDLTVGLQVLARFGHPVNSWDTFGLPAAGGIR